MPSPLTYSVRSYGGGAAPTTITQTITSSATSLPLADTTSWYETNTTSKLTTSGQIVLAIDYGLPTEEKVLCATGGLSGNGTNQTITVVTRGYDGTTGQSHSAGATVAVIVSSVELAEANKAAASTVFLNTTPAADPSFPKGITLSASTSSSFNGTVNTAAASNHSHPLDPALIYGLIDQTYIQNLQNNTAAQSSAGSAFAALPTTAPASTVQSGTATASITGVSTVMWVAKFQWHGATTSANQDVNAYLYKNEGAGYSIFDSASAGYMPSGQTAANMVMFVATSVQAGLDPTKTYTFGLNATTTTTIAANFNRFSLSVIGIP